MIAQLRQELAPSPLRWRGAFQITLICVLTVAIAMTLRLPEAALGCYLVFFAWRDDSVTSVMISIALCLAPAVVLTLALPLLRLSAESANWRVALMVSITFVGMTIAHASRVAPILGTLSFVFAFAVTLYDVVPEPDLLTRGMTWMIVIVLIPMGLAAVLAPFTGVPPDIRAAQILKARQQACENGDAQALARLANDGNGPLLGYIRKAKLIRHLTDARATQLTAQAEQSLIDVMRARADLPIRHGPPAPSNTPIKEPFFASGPFTDPAHMRFGAKVTLSVWITYLIYTVSGLFELHTAMITCFFVALGTGAETRHKITLRVLGAILGAILGGAVVFAVMPHVDDLGHLMILVALGAFPAAWISLGSERISYAGWQMALCYFLVILGGFGPVTSPSVAISRLIGVGLGIGTIWIVFAILWPARAQDKIARSLESFDIRIAQTAGHVLSGAAADWLNAPLAEAERVAKYLKYEGQNAAEVDAQIDLARAQFNRKLAHATGAAYA